MADRVSALDLALLYTEGASTPMHGGALAIFSQPSQGFDYDAFAALVASRIALVPRYRQRFKSVPGRLAGPVWVDDANFDLNYHLRRTALVRPGSDSQLLELVARVQSARLDRRRPLWEMYLVKGLSGNRFGIITKTHYALIDGVEGVDISQVILDAVPALAGVPSADGIDHEWVARTEPTPAGLVRDAMTDAVKRPGALLQLARIRALGARMVTQNAAGAAAGVLATARIVSRPAPGSALNASIGAQRRFAVTDTELASYRTIRGLRGGSVNDVVLSTVTGAVRGWLLSRGEAVTPSTVIRALVPLSMKGAHAGPTPDRIVTSLIDLPVGEPDPLVRLSQISYAMTAHSESSPVLGAEALVALSGFAPQTLHTLGAKAAIGIARRLFNLVVSNVPGPQVLMYAGGAPLLKAYPVVPLAPGQSLAIGLTSYDGHLYYGLNGDREAMHDIDVMAMMIAESLDELLECAVHAGATGRVR